ncbi:MAG: sulfatase-like hydrolase/transferase [Ferruginibacter sp.]
MIKMAPAFKHKFGPVLLVLLLVAGISFITRMVLLIKSRGSIDFNILHFAGIFLIGLFYDMVVGFFFSIPVALYCWLMKDSWYRSKWGRIPLFIVFSIITVILVFNAGGEITFWEEFNVRYNFIAVDYLIYTTEVIGNIKESYNMPLILGGVLLAAGAIVLLARKKLIASQQMILRFGKRSIYFLGIMLVACAGYFFVNNRVKNFSNNNYVNELAGNGIYEFGAAFWHNEIDYPFFYRTADNKMNFEILKNQLQQNNAVFNSDTVSLERKITGDSAERNWNIVLISVESLSGDYLKYFGGQNNITPYIDSLIPYSLFFSNFYATGTRTVRGLEALSLAIPPTPGQSIVRRPNNEGMFTMGSLLKKKGYDVHYVYGGNSFFDNMGYFFSNNGYKVLDERDIPEKIVHHKTAWGVADEDAFTIMMEECDKSFTAGKPFFNHLMTVSNHRPYTYPEGRIDIPGNAKSREGAVKYTDYCINKFIKDAVHKPWFNNTVFIVVADHCSKSAGKTDLPVNRYHIPCLVYAPVLIKPAVETRLMSQIDLAPTILGFMNLNYTSRFMGKDMYHSPASTDRAFISTYQNLGYLKGDTLTVLLPQKKLESYLIDYKGGKSTKISPSTTLEAEAIAWYQAASYLFNNKGYKIE